MNLLLALRTTALALGALLASPAAARSIEIDTTAARAVVDALAKPDLTPAEAHRVAVLAPNRMMIRKVQGFDASASEARFEAELLSAARGSAPAGRELFNFGGVRRSLEATRLALDAVERERDATIAWLDERLGRFRPPGSSAPLHGFLIAGGSATGFAFDSSGFYLDISQFAGDPGAVRVIVAHELYHEAQSAALEALGRGDRGFDPDAFAKIADRSERERYLVGAFLDSLLDEGAATYVGDPMLLSGPGQYSTDEGKRFKGAFRRPTKLTTLLDMSLLALTDEHPLAFDDVYGVSFYGPDQPLYYLGYSIAKAIVAHHGERRLGELALGRGCGFVQEYVELTRTDPSLTKLGAASERIVASHCTSARPPRM
jgi:Putative zinc dependent peptidase (DUF5700)